jgi:hypothetical protein
MTFRKIFYHGKACNEESEDMEGLVSELKSHLLYLHGLKVDELIGFFDALGKSWAKNPEMKKRFGSTLSHLIGFMSADNLAQMADTALRKRQALDGFVRLNDHRTEGGLKREGDKSRLQTTTHLLANNTLYHAQPRGLAIHWLAGNVPVLGIFSVLESVLTKNVNLVKASSRAYEDLVILLDSFSKVDSGNVKGGELLRTIVVILVDRNDGRMNGALSMAADIRIAWGGHEAIETITSLKKRFSTEDIIYGPKYSYAVIARECLDDCKKLAQRLAIDVSVFDQYACSSPHTLFVESGGKASALDFAKELANQLSLVNRTLLPKGRTEPAKVMDMLNVKSKYEMLGEVFSSEKNEWMVVYSEEEGLAEACFSRVIFVRPIDDVNRLAELNDRHKQTLGLAMGMERRFEFADRVTIHGIDRCPRFGQMSFFESPWDGMFSMDRMVRWVTCHE